MKILVATFCFLCSFCRILCVSVDISLNIRGYFITYPWIFHYVSTVTRVFCFVLAIYWLYVLGFSHIGGFVFTHTNLTDLTKYSFIAGFFFHANLANLAKFSFIADFGLTQISRISRKHTSLTLVCTIRLKTLSEADKRGRSDAPSVRFVRFLCEIYT